MQKSNIDIYSIIQTYLISIGVSKNFVQLQIIPNKFESPFYHHKQAKSNIVFVNKNETGSGETHIYILKKCWYMFF